MAEPFRFAILGAGQIAHKLADACRRVEGVTVCAVASAAEERARAFAEGEGIPAWYGSYAEALDRERPDCAYIATTVGQHFMPLMLCAERGIPVLCEKAMFASPREAETFYATHRAFAMEGLWSRFLPTNERARQLLREGALGEVTRAEVTLGFAPPFDPESRYFSARLGGGAARDLTVYAYELLTWLFSSPEAEARASAVMGPTGVDVTDDVRLTLRCGVPCQIHTTLAAPVREELVAHGTRGTLVVPHPHYADELFLYADPSAPPVLRERAAEENGFVHEVAEVTRCVRAGLKESPTVPWRDTLACARLLGRLTGDT